MLSNNTNIKKCFALKWLKNLTLLFLKEISKEKKGKTTTTKNKRYKMNCFVLLYTYKIVLN